MKKKILVIDDEPNIMEVVQNRLEANDYIVVTAVDGEEGLEVARRERPDLILLDILMPRMDGYSFVLNLRRDPALSRTPVIVLSAKDRMQGKFWLEGVTDYLLKPFKAEELLDKIRRYLEPATAHPTTPTREG